jgi:hypothetical protein
MHSLDTAFSSLLGLSMYVRARRLALTRLRNNNRGRNYNGKNYEHKLEPAQHISNEGS